MCLGVKFIWMELEWTEGKLKEMLSEIIPQFLSFSFISHAPKQITSLKHAWGRVSKYLKQGRRWATAVDPRRGRTKLTWGIEENHMGQLQKMEDSDTYKSKWKGSSVPPESQSVLFAYTCHANVNLILWWQATQWECFWGYFLGYLDHGRAT